MMTTDTADKEVLVDGSGFSVGGMAKGAAMLAPDMATMLAVLTTDASCEPRHALAGSSGAAVAEELQRDDRRRVLLDQRHGRALVERSRRSGHRCRTCTMRSREACALTRQTQMVADAEGASKVARVTVSARCLRRRSREGRRGRSRSPCS